MPSFISEEPQRISQLPRPKVSAPDNEVILKNGAFTKSWLHLIAGATGGMATALLTSPLDVLRTRLQSDFYQLRLTPNRGLRPSSTPASSFHVLRFSLLQFRETFQILYSIPRTEGWRGLFRGLGPNLAGVVPASAIKFYTYGDCKRIISEKLNHGKEAAWVHIIAAATAGMATGTATNPIWLIKTRLQLDRSRAEKTGHVVARQYKNSLDCIRQVLRHEGFKGMYRGLGASYLGAAESTLHLTVYEQLKILLARRQKMLFRNPRERKIWDQVLDWAGIGGAAGTSKLLAVLIAYPHEVLRTRLRQAPTVNGQLKYTGVVQCFRLIWKEEGFVSMYGGLTPHLLRAIPSAAITLGVYEFILTVFDARS